MQLHQGLGYAEKTDHGNDEMDAAQQRHGSKSKTPLGGQRVHADQAEDDPEGSGEDTFGHRFP